MDLKQMKPLFFIFTLGFALPAIALHLKKRTTLYAIRFSTRFLLPAICLVTAMPLRSQTIEASSNYNEKDLTDAFTLLGVRNFKYCMPAAFKGYYFDLIIKEYVDGVAIDSTYKSVSYSKMKHVLMWRPEQKDFCLGIQSLRNDSSEIFNVRLPGLHSRNNRLKLRLNRNEYEWESLTDSQKTIKPGQEIPLLTFSSAPGNKEHPNILKYCELSKTDYRQWYTKYKIRHYFVLLTRITLT